MTCSFPLQDVNLLFILYKVLNSNNRRIFIYENLANNYRVEIELADNIWKIEQPNGNIFSKHKFKINKWTWNGTDNATDAEGKIMEANDRIAFCEQKRTKAQIFEIINHSTGIAIPANPNSEIKIGETGSLNDLLQ